MTPQIGLGGLSHGRAGGIGCSVGISTDKRYDSIGSAPAGIVGVGSALIPGHFRLGRLNEAAGVCGGRGPFMGFELGS
jgi:hypothetical protein